MKRQMKKCKRWFSFLLVLFLLLSDQSLQYVRAAELPSNSTYSTYVAEESTEATTQEAEESTEATTQEVEESTEATTQEAEESTEATTQEAEESTEVTTQEAEESTEATTREAEESTEATTQEAEESKETTTQEDMEKVLPRMPEAFHAEPEPENYGTLVSYDRYSRTYQVSEGNYVTVIGYDGSTYIDEEGQLQQVDNTLMVNPVAAFSRWGESATGYVNRAGRYTAALSSTVDVSVSDLLTISSGDYLLTMTPTEGVFADGVVSDNAIRYNDVFPGVDYQYTVLGNSVKEDIILLEPGEQHSFSYRVNTYGLEAQLINNVIYLYETDTDPETEAVFVLEAPEMEDGAGEISLGIRLSMETVADEWGGEYLLVTATADSDWLNAPERMYPVRIDPTAVQLNPALISMVGVAQGRPDVAIGEDNFPYVGYDNGFSSGNQALYGTGYLNSRTYIGFDYDFTKWAEEPEIVRATFRLTPRTTWSKGQLQVGLYAVDNEWEEDTITWNSQEAYSHRFLDAQQVTMTKKESLYFDVTEEISAWINGVRACNGMVMKAMTEAPLNGDNIQDTQMPCELFYTSASSTYAPKLVISWMGGSTPGTPDDPEEPVDPDQPEDPDDPNAPDIPEISLDDITIDIYPVVARNGQKSSTTLGVVAHGVAQPGSIVHYSLVNGETGEVEVQEELIYPDSALYKEQFQNALDYKRRLSNWQSEVFHNLKSGKVYYIEAYAEGIMDDGVTEGVGETVRSDSFLIYRESALDMVPRIAQYYGVDVNQILIDMSMQDVLSKDGNLLFIRNPQVPGEGSDAGIGAGELSDYYKAAIDGLLLGRAQGCEFGHDPINLNTGNYYMEQQDVTMDEIGGEFSICRQYNSKAAAFKGSMGYGWSFAYDERLGELSDGSILWLQSNGGMMTFSPAEEGYAAPAGYDYELTEGEGGYTVTNCEEGSSRVFDQYGLLTAVKDVQGDTITLHYDVDYRLSKIITPSGKHFHVTLDEQERISSITQPDGGCISYTYDEAGDLVAVTNPAGGTLRYTYDDTHQMTAWYDENDHRVIENVYDDRGRVICQTDAEGAVITLAYEYTEGQGGSTISTDALGHVTTYRYDEKYRTTDITYPDGTTESRSYDAAGYPAQMTDRMGSTTTYGYDERGNVLTETRADGAVCSYTYNDRNQVLTITAYDGGTTGYSYDDKGRLTGITDALGQITTYGYDGQNRLTSVTDARGHVTTYSYEGACVTTMTDAAGHTWNYTYDAMNRLLTTTDPKGQTSTNTYDALGRVVAKQDAAGAVTTYTFDRAGAVTAITDKEGHKSTFTYDGMNRLLTGVDPLGHTLTYTYDASGNKLTQTDAEGQTICYTYDAMNRVTAVTDAAGAEIRYSYNGLDRMISVTDPRGYTASLTYDPVKQVMTSETDKEGHVTTYTTDVMGRVTGIAYPDGSSVSYIWNQLGQLTGSTNQLGIATTYTYDANGNVTMINEGGREYHYTYDKLNRPVQTTDPLGHQISYTYDALGNVTAITDGRGNTTDYKYDAVSRLIQVQDAMDGITGYTYDKEGRVLTVTAPMGDTVTNDYDAIGQLTSQTDALGQVTAYTYDGISRLTGVTDVMGGSTTYTHDVNGYLTSATDALGNSHSYTLDAGGYLLTDTYPNGEQESYTYDGNGNVLTYTDRYGIVTTLTYDTMGRVIKAVDTAGNEMSYTYDGAGNLLTQTDVAGRTATYTYDAFGRPVSITGIDGVTTAYAYDALDRLLRVTEGEGRETCYEYDATGNLIHTTEPGEAEYSYTYDALNRLTGKVDPMGATTTFLYDQNSNLTRQKDGNGTTTSYAYDALNRPVSYTDGNGGITGYTYDALSRLTAITSPEGLTESYSYDAVANLTSVTDALGQTTTYTYDKLYRLVAATSPLGAVEKYTYDKHDVVTSVTDPLGEVTLYTVNGNGQVTEKLQPNGGKYTYSYDALQRLVGMTTPLGYELEFTYSAGNDILTQTDILGRTTTYAYDIMHRVTSVTDAEGGVTTYGYDVRGNRSEMVDALGYAYSYIYDKVDRLITVTDPEEKVTSLLYDMVGNVTAITTPGERTTAYTYDGNYNTVAVTDPMGYVYSYGYDKDDRLTGTTDPLRQQDSYTYDAVSRVTAYMDRMGLTERFTYDAHGNVLERTDTYGLTTGYTYDLKNRLTSVTDPMGSVAYYTYDVMDHLLSVTDYLGRGISYTYDLEGNLTSITDTAGRTETMTYDMAGRVTSYTSHGGNRISYDYDKLDNLVEKAYNDINGAETAQAVAYAYDSLGQRVAMYDSTGDAEYTYDGLGRITSVTTYRTPDAEGEGFSHEDSRGDTICYTYDEANNLSAITYPDGTQVSYGYDKNDNLIRVTDREGLETTYVYDEINRITQMHRPNGISTYNTYNARNQITELKNICDGCEWVVSQYSYTYDDRGYIIAETAIESLAGYAYDDKHNGKHTDGRHDDLYPHGTKHAKHDKDATFAYRIVQTDRTFIYDDAGKLLSATETEDNYGTYVYTYEYDLMGNRTAMTKTAEDGTVAEWHKYTYNDSNQLISEELYNGKKTTTLTYTYDEDGNRISQVGKVGTDKVEKYYEYTIENRLAAVYDKEELLMAAAYDGDGNRVFQLNYNLHTDEDWKGNSGNGNGSNKDNAGSGSSNTTADAEEDGSGSSVNGNGNTGNSSANNGKGGNGKSNGNTKKSSTTDTTTATSSTGNGNATNAEENNSQNQCGILFPIDEEVSDTEQSLINKIKTAGKQKNYELIEYINDVNREYAEVLVEQNINGATDTSYIYGVERLSLDRFDGSTGYYLYDPRGSVAGITNEEGQIYQSYRYSVTGEITFGAPTYENEYTYNGESYNPNIQSQYLRARYYDVVTATFLTEDTYLGNIIEPLTLNRYNYCVSSYANYNDPSGHFQSLFYSKAIWDVCTEVPQIQEQTGLSYTESLALYVIGKEEQKANRRDAVENWVAEELSDGGVIAGGVMALSGATLPTTSLASDAVFFREIAQKDYDGAHEESMNMVTQGTAGAAGQLFDYLQYGTEGYLAKTLVQGAIGAKDLFMQMTEWSMDAPYESMTPEGQAGWAVLSLGKELLNQTWDFGKDFVSGEHDNEIGRSFGANDFNFLVEMVATAGLLKYAKICDVDIDADDFASSTKYKDIDSNLPKNNTGSLKGTNRKVVEGGTSTSRPTWRQSETDVGDLNPSYEAQKSFLNGKEVPYATRGSSRPDFYTTGLSIEVKNYNVTNSSGRNSLINTVSNQVNKRITDLPSGTKQTIIIDVRGQQVTNDVLRQIRTSILEKCNTDVIIQFMR